MTCAHCNYDDCDGCSCDDCLHEWRYTTYLVTHERTTAFETLPDGPSRKDLEEWADKLNSGEIKPTDSETVMNSQYTAILICEACHKLQDMDDGHGDKDGECGWRRGDCYNNVLDFLGECMAKEDPLGERIMPFKVWDDDYTKEGDRI